MFERWWTSTLACTPRADNCAMSRDRELIMGSWIDRLEWDETLARILAWAAAREHRAVCVCNVHSVVTARSDAALRAAVNGADLVTPDGMPVAWLIGRRRGARQARINGPDLTIALCREAAARGISVAFYGSTQESLARLRVELAQRFPALRVAATISPPFRALETAETKAFCRQISDCGAGLVFVGLGCPKQEIWMADNRYQISAVTLGVGAAFEFIAGTVRRPPVWMQRLGLEWLGRLWAEPRRLWRRYLVTNSVYTGYVLHELLTGRRHNTRRRDA